MRLFSSMVAICVLSSCQAQAQQPRIFSCVTGSYRERGDLRFASSFLRGGKAKGQRFQVNTQTGAMSGEPGFSSSHWKRTKK